MDSANQNRQSLVYADGYSYTEIFPAPELPEMPRGSQLIRVFHAFFTADRDNGTLNADPAAVLPEVETEKNLATSDNLNHASDMPLPALAP